jgi:hypothetical protein
MFNIVVLISIWLISGIVGTLLVKNYMFPHKLSKFEMLWLVSSGVAALIAGIWLGITNTESPHP